MLSVYGAFVAVFVAGDYQPGYINQHKRKEKIIIDKVNIEKK